MTEMNLPAGWYVVAESIELSKKKPQALRRFGKDWVVWRHSSGSWIMQEDRCPHRSARLSGGRLGQDCVVCPFHGFQFDKEGACSHAPEIGRSAPGLRVKTHQLVEKNGFLWMAWRDPKGSIPWFDDLDHSVFKYITTQHRWKTHYSRCVENQLDHSHLPFVHKTTIGIGIDPAKKVDTEAGADAIRVGLGGEAYLEFRYPNIWHLRPINLMREFLAFVPVSDHETLIYMRHYQKILSWPLLGRALCWILSVYNRKVLSQDHSVVVGQHPQNVQDATDERLMESDRAIRAFRKWLVQ